MSIDQKFSELGIELPPAPQAAGLYKTVLYQGIWPPYPDIFLFDLMVQ